MATDSATVSTAAPKAQNSRPMVNLYDLPELLPGAQPNANPAQREEFEQRCRQLHQHDVQDQYEANHRAAVTRMGAGVGATSSDLEAMFPTLDPSLVRALVADSPTPQDAIETLLALAAATGDPGERPPTPPPLNLGVEDIEKFPSLVDGDGWQVGTQRQFDRDPDEDLGSAWRDRAKKAAPLPAPPVQASTNAWSAAAAAKRRERKESNAEEKLMQQPETEYEARQRKGQQRAKNRAQYGRGTRTASAKGANKTSSLDDSSESEVSDEEEPGA